MMLLYTNKSTASAVRICKITKVYPNILHTSVSGKKVEEFEPKLIPKYQRDVSGIEEQVISLYTRGMSTRDIHDQVKDIYGIKLSAEMVSKITDKILPQVKEWHSEAYRVVLSPGSHLSICIHELHSL